MSSLQNLLAQREELETLIRDMQREQRGDAVSKVKALMAEFGLSAHDIAGNAPAARNKEAKATVKVAPKYRNATGQTWSGRGLKPKWLSAAIAGGAAMEDFKV